VREGRQPDEMPRLTMSAMRRRHSPVDRYSVMVVKNNGVAEMNPRPASVRPMIDARQVAVGKLMANRPTAATATQVA